MLRLVKESREVIFSTMENCSDITNHQCRPYCGACCIMPSISSPIPGMHGGKPANTKCIQLSDDLLCNLFNQSNRPDVCKNFRFDPVICGKNKDDAMNIMSSLE